MAKEHYIAEGWKCDAPSGICDGWFDASSEEVKVTLNPDYKDIGKGWQVMPQSIPSEVSVKFS